MQQDNVANEPNQLCNCTYHAPKVTQVLLRKYNVQKVIRCWHTYSVKGNVAFYELSMANNIYYIRTSVPFLFAYIFLYVSDCSVECANRTRSPKTIDTCTFVTWVPWSY